ncbi:hypothetical protein [Microbacterium karelineae]|uniref:hypothetical protein n=1 Tax=Microbacterium karelineae TaxID=2654283 RepID=UPI0012EA7270|nr:hypothetical protein [Microbacterium karelineae]
MSAPAAAPRPVRRRRGLGIVAFIAAVAAVAIGAVGIWLAGFSLGRLVRLTDYPDLLRNVDDVDALLGDAQDQLWESLGRAGLALGILVIAWLAHALVALWGLVQGIVATALDRGRMWGVIAIVVACTGWIVLAVFMQEALLAGLLGNIPFFG